MCARGPAISRSPNCGRRAAQGSWNWKTGLRVFFDDDTRQSELQSRFGGEIEPADTRDWVAFAHEYLKPMEIGQRIFVCPEWRDDPTPPGRIRIVVNAGLAFGTGAHETTRLCLEAIERHLKPGMTRGRRRHRLRHSRRSRGQTRRRPGLGERQRSGGGRGRAGEFRTRGRRGCAVGRIRRCISRIQSPISSSRTSARPGLRIWRRSGRGSSNRAVSRSSAASKRTILPRVSAALEACEAEDCRRVRRTGMADAGGGTKSRFATMTITKTAATQVAR